MPRTPFTQLMKDAAEGRYAVGYFECWDFDSALAVAEAAESTGSPVLLGFSGIYLPRAFGARKEMLSVYAALGTEICQKLSVPACLVFNESSHLDWVMEAIEVNFGLVMFTDESLACEEQICRVQQVAERAHRASVAVEGELTPLPGVSGSLAGTPDDLRLTGPEEARSFVAATGVDALAVNVGQAHFHGRKEAKLEFSRLAALGQALTVPMVLHAASSIPESEFPEAIRLGVRKINVGSMLKRVYFEALRAACGQVNGDYNPYEVVGSGERGDVLVAARSALRQTVEHLMVTFGSAGRAR
jgi:fructose/tagatose bisphosphate aldolase